MVCIKGRRSPICKRSKYKQGQCYYLHVNSGPSGDITLENNDIFHKLRPDWYGCRFCGT